MEFSPCSQILRGTAPTVLLFTIGERWCRKVQMACKIMIPQQINIYTLICLSIFFLLCLIQDNTIPAIVSSILCLLVTVSEYHSILLQAIKLDAFIVQCSLYGHQMSAPVKTMIFFIIYFYTNRHDKIKNNISNQIEITQCQKYNIDITFSEVSVPLTGLEGLYFFPFIPIQLFNQKATKNPKKIQKIAM